MLVFNLAVGVVLFVVGCVAGADLPDADPSIRGTITSLTPTADGAVLMVEAGATVTYEYDRASVTVTTDTHIYAQDPDGRLTRISAADLASGQIVDVWFSGAVAESYPVQAHAGTLVVLR
jgi:hypothetical protein